MIGSIRGTVIGTIRGDLLIETGGIGYRIAVTAQTMTRIADGQEVLLYTHEAVRETADDLFGFLEKDDLMCFELLLTVSGVGPKSALAVMNAVESATLRSAIARGDAKALSSAYGIGKKTAEKIVLELREKMVAPDKGTEPGIDHEVLEVLVGLGYSQKEARDAVRALPRSLVSPEEKIREAIKLASRTL